MEEKRWCYNCKHGGLCYIRRKMDDFIQDCLRSFDVDKKGTTPGFWQDLFITLGSICQEYELKKEG